MAIAYEKNTDLAFDTGILRKAATEYANVAEELRNMAERLDSLIQALKDQGWTTPTGTAFYEMTNVNWKNNIEKYAASKNISVSWFIQNFKQYTNTTPAQYIQNLRLSNAKSLLETTNYNVTEISNLVGYENPLYFSRFFRKQFGASPSQFRKQLRQNEENQMTEPEKK